MTRARVLVVDDEADMRASVERVLSEDYDVLACPDGPAALSRLEEFVPELALIDVRMPGMDGFELLVALQERLPGLDVILMTGSLTEPDAKLVRAIRTGAYYYLEKPLNRDVLLTLVDRCLTARRLAQENRRLERRKQRELDAARTFQLGMLPREVPEEAHGLEAWAYVPSSELSGDFVDVAWLDANRVAVLVADVVGHGASAAMLTASLKAAFQLARADECAPEDVVEAVAAFLAPHPPDRFVTLFCARFDRVSGELEYVNAGHPAGIVRRAGGEIVQLDSTGPLVNCDAVEVEWETASMTLSPGDVLLLMTDGVLEARRGSEEFGIDRVLEILEQTTPDPGAITREIVGQVLAFVASPDERDDLTLFCLTAGVGPASPAHRLGPLL